MPSFARLDTGALSAGLAQRVEQSGRRTGRPRGHPRAASSRRGSGVGQVTEGGQSAVPKRHGRTGRSDRHTTPHHTTRAGPPAPLLPTPPPAPARRRKGGLPGGGGGVPRAAPQGAGALPTRARGRTYPRGRPAAAAAAAGSTASAAPLCASRPGRAGTQRARSGGAGRAEPEEERRRRPSGPSPARGGRAGRRAGCGETPLRAALAALRGSAGPRGPAGHRPGNRRGAGELHSPTPQPCPPGTGVLRAQVGPDMRGNAASSLLPRPTRRPPLSIASTSSAGHLAWPEHRAALAAHAIPSTTLHICRWPPTPSRARHWSPTLQRRAPQTALGGAACVPPLPFGGRLCAGHSDSAERQKASPQRGLLQAE